VSRLADHPGGAEARTPSLSTARCLAASEFSSQGLESQRVRELAYVAAMSQRAVYIRRRCVVAAAPFFVCSLGRSKRLALAAGASRRPAVSSPSSSAGDDCPDEEPGFRPRRGPRCDAASFPCPSSAHGPPTTSSGTRTSGRSGAGRWHWRPRVRLREDPPRPSWHRNHLAVVDLRIKNPCSALRCPRDAPRREIASERQRIALLSGTGSCQRRAALVILLCSGSRSSGNVATVIAGSLQAIASKPRPHRHLHRADSGDAARRGDGGRQPARRTAPAR